jgi:surfactin synthase thioesterase subunit
MPDERDAIGVVGLAAVLPGVCGVEDFWVWSMTGERQAPVGTDAAPPLRGIVAAAVEDAGHAPVGAFGGDQLVVFEAGEPDSFAALHEAMLALDTGTCEVAVVAAADATGACAIVLRRCGAALDDHDDVRALLVEASARHGSDELVEISVPFSGSSRVAALGAVVSGVLSLDRGVLAGRPPMAWPRPTGRRRVVAFDNPAAPLAVECATARTWTLLDRRPRVLVWSGDTAAEERAARFRLAQSFVVRGEGAFADTAASLQERQVTGPVRAAAVCTGALDASAVLGAVADERVHASAVSRPAALLFSGRGAPATTRAPSVPAIVEALETWPADVAGHEWNIVLAAAVAGAWIAAGVRPVALVASGAGIVAAAVAADVIDPPTAARLLAARRAPDSVAATASALAGLDLRPPTVPLLCAVGGQPAATDPQAWLAPEVAAERVIEVALGAGAEVLVEMGPEGALARAAHAYSSVRAFAAIDADGTEEALLDGIAQAWTEGHDVDWRALGQVPPRRRVALPAGLPPAPFDRPATCSGMRRARRARSSVADWIERVDDDAPGPTVVAMPYAGGAARALRFLRRFLPQEYGLALVDLPGHGRLMDQPCQSDVEEVLAGLEEAIATLPGEVVLLGYSLGGTFGHELAGRMVERGSPPAGLIICGTRAPHTGVGHVPVANAAAGEPFLRAAIAMQLAAPEMLQIPELAETFAAPLHADLSMVESFPFRHRAPLPVPTCIVGFRSDWLVTEPSLRAWDDLIADPPLHLRTGGGHLALHERQDEFGAAIATAVTEIVGDPVSRPAIR